MSLEEQRKELTKIIEEATKKNQEMKKSFEPLKVVEGFWFNYKNRIFILKGLKDNQPEFIEYLKEVEDMPIDGDGNWSGHLNNITISDMEFEYFKVAKDLFMNMKINLDDFKSIKNFIEKIDITSMSLFEATVFNILTGKTFVKNSWSEDARSRLQMFLYDNKLITQDGDGISTKSSTVKLDNTEKYSLYKGEYKSIINSNNEKVQKLKQLEQEILPFYNKMKEYENLKRELNL